MKVKIGKSRILYMSFWRWFKMHMKAGETMIRLQNLHHSAHALNQVENCGHLADQIKLSSDHLKQLEED